MLSSLAGRRLTIWDKMLAFWDAPKIPRGIAAPSDYLVRSVCFFLRHLLGALPKERVNHRVKELRSLNPIKPAMSDSGLSLPSRYWPARLRRTFSTTPE